MKKLLSASAFSAILLFSGCGDENATCRIDVQKDIDQGKFESAIEKLNGSCKDTYNESDRLYSLATAYMGESGYGISDAIRIMIEANDNSGNGSFTSFTQSIDDNKKENSLELLTKSKNYFLRSLDPSITDTNQLFKKYCSNEQDFNNSRISNACFYVGFDEVVRTSVTVGGLTKDLTKTLEAIDSDDSTEVPLDMKVSLDALAWATNQTIKNGSTIDAKDVTITNTPYRALTITNNGETFYRLADADAPSSSSSTIFTQGYCTTDGDKTACEGIENDDGSIDTTVAGADKCYACPVSLDENTSGAKVTELLVETLNNGTDSILSITDDEDIAQSIEEFKEEITGDKNKDITVSDIIDYLNAEK
ncbi:hypothetical protein MNB_SM-7-1231 [hydrothermal vent metagenome]|uniref:Lipoprotein n=1 Tax=hydrothermal vent metagenome TaxID=652676 RepID=A0A1W1BFE2_9ZZZZ